MKWIVEAETLEDMLNDNYNIATLLTECKDCKNYSFCKDQGCKEDDFCSYAERREE